MRAMAAAAAGTTSPKSVAGINLGQFWDYSLNVAKVSRSLAGVVRQNQQAAFTAGLIHAVGELAMHLGMPDEMARIEHRTPRRWMRNRAKVEMRHFDYCYAQVGAGYARKWLFPQPIVDALEHQYAPFKDDCLRAAGWRDPPGQLARPRQRGRHEPTRNGGDLPRRGGRGAGAGH